MNPRPTGFIKIHLTSQHLGAAVRGCQDCWWDRKLAVVGKGP